MPNQTLQTSHNPRTEPPPCVRTCGLLLIGGAIHSLTFAPDPLPAWLLPYIQMLSMAVLVYCVWRAHSVRYAASFGLFFGLGHFTVGLYWLHISIHTHGGVAWLPAALAVLLLALFESLFYAAASSMAWYLCAHARRTTPDQTQHTCATSLALAITWASSWVLWEWLRGTLLTGFPWLNIGYAHVDGVFSGWASTLGVYGVAWFAALSAATLAALAVRWLTPMTIGTLLPVVLCCGASMIAGALLPYIPWGSPHGSPIQVRLVQGNIAQSNKFDPHLLRQSLDTYRTLALRPTQNGTPPPDLIVLPETVIPVLQDRLSTADWQQWLAVAHAQQAIVVLGVPIHRVHDTHHTYTNSVVAFDATTPVRNLIDGSVTMRYDKSHLVPFGEFIPTGFRWFVDAMAIPLGDFNRGAQPQAPFPIAGQRIAPNICYEDVFGEEIRQAVQTPDQGATVLMNFSNLGWFGDSWALRQHLQMARMRSLETYRPMLRATNTGMTAAISPTGIVYAFLPAQQSGVLDVSVQGMVGLTPYVRFGNAPVLIGLVLALMWLLYRCHTQGTQRLLSAKILKTPLASSHDPRSGGFFFVSRPSHLGLELL